MYFKLSIVISSFSMSATSITRPNRFRAPRIAWCRKGHLFVLTIVHKRPSKIAKILLSLDASAVDPMLLEKLAHSLRFDRLISFLYKLSFVWYMFQEASLLLYLLVLFHQGSLSFVLTALLGQAFFMVSLQISVKVFTKLSNY